MDKFIILGLLIVLSFLFISVAFYKIANLKSEIDKLKDEE